MYSHVWFSTKYRKAILEAKIEGILKSIFADCISRHKFKVLEFSININHVHLLVEIEDKNELSAMIRTLKCVSAKEIFRTPYFRMGHKSIGARNTALWARRYGSREIDGKEIEDIRRYIRNQKNILHATGGSL